MASEHPSKKFLLVGGLMIGMGILRGRLSGLVLLVGGGLAVAKAVQLLHETNDLHGGNYHGYNRPPNHKLEDRVAML